MKVPQINTTKGKQPVTVVPDELLVEGFLSSEGADADDVDLVRLLEYAEPDAKKNGAILGGAWKVKPGFFLYIRAKAKKSLPARRS